MNKTILTLIERASRKGVAKVNAYYTGWYGEKKHIEKYRVTFEAGEWELYHYETLTATVVNGIGNVLWGQSRSDLDSINTFLTELTGQAPEMHYYPSRGVFQVVENSKVTQEF